MFRETGYGTCMGEKRNSYKILVRKSEVYRPLGRPWRKREENIMWLQETGCYNVSWIHLAQDRIQ
jgi:hypothetical protein